MPEIGRPVDPNQSSYSNIQINRTPSPQAQAEKKVGDSLNKLAGNRPESRFVDRRSKEELGQDGFMKLLAHQLKNQDPMKPMDQKDFSANLAQFSQLEQLTAMNKKLDSVNQNAIDDKRVQGASFLGKKVVTAGTSIDYKGDGKDTNLPFHLEKPAKMAIINVYDDKRQLVARLEREGLNKGMQEVTWDGTDFNGQVAPKETYTFEVIAFDEVDQKFMGSTKAEGLVTGVHFEEGETVLTLANGRKVFLKDVQSFSLDTEKNASSKNMPALQKQAAQTYNQIDNQINN